MKVEKISTKLIKPHTPTPQNLKNYNISFLDKLMATMNFAVILFYQSKLRDDINHLEESLSKTLVQFYPLARRYSKNDLLIDCSDQGVEFVEAEALDVDLTELVARADAEQLNDLLPDQYFRVDEASHVPLLSIQATHFRCGGVAIAVSVSHRIFDATSLETFVAAWSESNTTNPDNKTVELITPSFDLHSLLPCKDHYFGESSNDQKIDKKIVVKRLLFNKEALTRLKSKIRPNNNGKTISEVRVVCAVIAKAVIGVDCAKNGKINGDFLIAQLVNMRGRTILPQPKHACGNLVIPTLTQRVTAAEAEVIGMEELVDVIGASLRKSIPHYAEILSPNLDGGDFVINTATSLMMEAIKPETNIIVFSDWSKFGFNEADFGFGKPVWTGIGPQRPESNTTVLMSNKEGKGIEAWVHMNPNDMRYFEEDEEIKLFLTS